MTAESLEVGGILLLVEGERAGRRALERAFASFPAIRPLAAADGRAALEVLRRFPVDVLIAGEELLAVCRRRYPDVVAFGWPSAWEGLKEAVLTALADAGRQRRERLLQAWAGGAEGRCPETARLLARLEARDPLTARHSWRVAEAARLFDGELGLSPVDLYAAALLHDVGLRIPARLDGLAGFSDRSAEAAHPLESERLVLRLPGGPRIASWIRHHHERFDGSGIPDALHGSRIPLGARALRVVDAYDEMTESGIREAAGLQSLMQRAGTEFDPRIAKLFVLRVLQLAAAGRPPA